MVLGENPSKDRTLISNKNHSLEMGNFLFRMKFVGLLVSVEAEGK